MNNDAIHNIMDSIAGFSDFLFSLSPFQFTLLATILGFALSEALTVNQQNSFGNFLEAVGQLMLTFNAQAETLNQAANKTYQEQFNELRIKVDELLRNYKKQ